MLTITLNSVLTVTLLPSRPPKSNRSRRTNQFLGFTISSKKEAKAVPDVEVNTNWKGYHGTRAGPLWPE